MRLTPVLTTLAVPVLLVGGMSAAESLSQNRLTGALTQRVEKALPDALVETVNLRGRPYVVSSYADRISTAYVEIKQPDRTRATLLVQNLDLNRDSAHRVRVFVRIPYGQRTKHVLDAAGANTPRGRLADGTPVTWSARKVGATLQVRASSGRSPKSVDLPTLKGLRIDGRPLSYKDGVQVELVAADLSMPA